MKNNSIILTKKQIKRLLYKNRLINNSKNYQLLKDISSVKITFDNGPEWSDLWVYFKNKNIINQEKK